MVTLMILNVCLLSMLFQLSPYSTRYCKEREGVVKEDGVEEAPARAKAARRAACARGWKVYVSSSCVRDEVWMMFVRPSRLTALFLHYL